MLTKLLSLSITPTLKAIGFHKTGTNYHRRLGATVQVVNIQASRGSSRDRPEFYINLGIAFDAICELVRLPILEHPKEYECEDRGTRDRLDAFCRHASPSWVIRDRQHLETLATELRELMEDLRSELDKINGPDSYRTHTWFERFRPAKTNAQILYLLGDHHGARREIDGLVNQFANRVNANRADWWLEQLGLRALG